MTDTALVPAQQSLAETVSLAEILAKSGFFEDSREAAQAVVKVLAGRELGFGPIASMTGIFIVKGRVTLGANLMAAAVKRSGRYDFRVAGLDEQRCTIDFVSTSTGEILGRSEFTLADAQRARLAGGDNWKMHPRNMLFARAMSNGVKWYCPDVFGGPLYTPDELGAQVDADGDVVEVPADEGRPVPTSPPEPPPPEPPPVAP